MNNLIELLKSCTKRGTRACGAACAVAGIILAVLLLTIGPWKTVFIIAFGIVGAFIGGVGNKKEYFKNSINKNFPPKE